MARLSNFPNPLSRNCTDVDDFIHPLSTWPDVADRDRHRDFDSAASACLDRRSGRYGAAEAIVTDDAARSEGWGGQLLDWLIEAAREEGCQQFHLDSGVQRFGAHRFYLMKRMQITCHHFAMNLGTVGGG